MLAVLSVGRYPEALDSVLEKHLEDCTDEADQNLFHQFISLSLSCGKYKVGRSSVRDLFSAYTVRRLIFWKYSALLLSKQNFYHSLKKTQRNKGTNKPQTKPQLT